MITSEELQPADLQKARAPVAHASKDNLDEINEGDVLLVEPDAGNVSVLYETASPHNALLVTERCNCSCIMCPQPPREQEESLTPLNMRLIDLMRPGPRVLALTGGEPTLARDDFIALVERCKSRLPDTRLVVLTNGRLFKDRRYVERLVGVSHPRLLVAVALYSEVDSLHDRIAGAEGAFADTIRGLHNLALYRVPTELRTVVLRPNYRRLQQFADFAYRNLSFIVHLAFMGLETTGYALRNLNAVWVDPYDTAPQLAAACKFLWRRMVPVSVYNYPLCVIPRQIWPLARRSISGWKNVYLEECEGCAVKDRCCGLFESSTAKHSDYIHPIQESA